MFCCILKTSQRTFETHHCANIWGGYSSVVKCFKCTPGFNPEHHKKTKQYAKIALLLI